jgi:triacylglycerol lipase
MHLVDPALRPLLEAWPTFSLSAEKLVQMREREELMPFEIDREGSTLEIRTVPGPAGAPDRSAALKRGLA